MLNLHEESIYLRGARDILLRLQDDFDMYLIPCGKFYSKTDNGKYEYFPITNNGTRKLIGSAFVEAILSHREQLSRFLQGNYKELQIKSVKTNKKGKIEKYEIAVV
jgi:hypothetical protein